MPGIRKIVTLLEEVRAEGGASVEPPARLAAAGAVVENVLAGAFAEDLAPLVEAYCESLGQLLTERALGALASPAEGYGKGALVGLDGEIEHGSAVIHNLRFGNHVRGAVEGTSLLPAAEKRGTAGASLDIPLKHTQDHTVRSHHQTIEVRIPDAPRANELVVWVALASSGRPHARLAPFASELSDDST